MEAAAAAREAGRSCELSAVASFDRSPARREPGTREDFGAHSASVARLVHTANLELVRARKKNAVAHFKARRGDARAKAFDVDSIATARAARELVAATDPALVAFRAQTAEKHRDRRRRRAAKPGRGNGAPQNPSELLDKVRAAAKKGRPTRSAPLNVFLRMLGEFTFYRADADLPDDRRLSLSLLTRARKEMIETLVRCGSARAALAFATILPRGIQSGADARVFVLSASCLSADSDLGLLSRELVRALEARDAMAVSVTLAAFAGRMIHYAAKRRGPHVRKAVIEDLVRWIDSSMQKRMSRRGQRDRGAAR